MYIYENKNWPKFSWNDKTILPRLLAVKQSIGRLYGMLEAQGLEVCREANYQILTQDVIKTSEIEGEHLDLESVRSSLAKKLGIETNLKVKDKKVEGIVELLLDAQLENEKKLSKARLFKWHKLLFKNSPKKITVARWRLQSSGPMQVVSGGFGREKVHFEAPEAKVLEREMKGFFKWLNDESDQDLVLKSAIAHLWFITIHPFEDGNGRIARAISDMLLSRNDKSSFRYYSMSSQILIERKDYYQVLENSQRGDLDITGWITWYLQCLANSIEQTAITLNLVMEKSRFWKTYQKITFNERQKAMLIKVLDGQVEQLTSSKWAKMTKVSQDTAHRDIIDLVDKKVLEQSSGGGRNTSYCLVIMSAKR
jgi:Fic family protein